MRTDSLIWCNWDQVSGEVGALMQRYAALPRHIAKKHLKASMKRALRPGVPALKKATPKRKTFVRFGQNVVSGEYTATKIKGGALRRAATAKSYYKGTNRDGYAVGVLGYKYGTESRKAIWLEFGTDRIKPRGIVRGVMQSFKPQAQANLLKEMTAALENAAKELASGKAVGTDYRRKPRRR